MEAMANTTVRGRHVTVSPGKYHFAVSLVKIGLLTPCWSILISRNAENLISYRSYGYKLVWQNEY